MQKWQKIRQEDQWGEQKKAEELCKAQSQTSSINEKRKKLGPSLRNRLFVTGSDVKVPKAKRKVGLTVTRPTAKAATSLVVDLMEKKEVNIHLVDQLLVHAKKKAKASLGVKKQLKERKGETFKQRFAKNYQRRIKQRSSRKRQQASNCGSGNFKFRIDGSPRAFF